MFFGGGTPSLAQPSTISAVLEAVSKQARLSGEAEVTLEVNPTPEGMRKLEDFHRAGVNRFSIGVQVNKVSALIDTETEEEFYKCLCFISSVFAG